jgi:hypothetical protein
VSARLALYWAPALEDPLHKLASAWLGRDAQTGQKLAQPDVPGIEEITAEPRLYGLHATLKAPFRLSTSYAAARDAAAALAARTAPFTLPPLEIRDLRGFLALRESEPCQPLQDFCAACVEALEPHRAPLTEAEIARRRPERMPERERSYLMRWGYPYVMDAFWFHVTLTRRLTEAEKATILPAVTAYLGDAPARPRLVKELCLFTQAGPGEEFRIAERLPLRG